ncbi:hypothetical protein ACHY83_001875, partial [Enterococcus faecalis]
ESTGNINLKFSKDGDIISYSKSSISIFKNGSTNTESKNNFGNTNDSNNIIQNLSSNKNIPVYTYEKSVTDAKNKPLFSHIVYLNLEIVYFFLGIRVDYSKNRV